MAKKKQETFTCPFCGKTLKGQRAKKAHQKTKKYQQAATARIEQRKAEFAAKKKRARERKIAEIEAQAEWDQATHEFLLSQGITWEELAPDEKKWLKSMTAEEIRDALAYRGGH